jgi:Rieske Fe-S protein
VRNNVTEETGTHSEPSDYSQHSATNDQLSISRRWLLLKIGIAFNAVVGLVLATPIIGYLLAPIKRDRAYKSWVSLGGIEKYPIGQTRLATYINPWKSPSDGQTDDIPCWVQRRTKTDFTVFAINCAHLGCPVRWFPQSQLFMCPCHGGVYYADGSVAAGPPPRGLFKYQHKITGGELQIFAGQIPTLSNTAQLVNIGGCKGDSPCAG